MPKASDKRLKYIAEYDATNTIQIRLKLNKIHDADVIRRLQTVGNKQGYIKDLIRKDIKGE